MRIQKLEIHGSKIWRSRSILLDFQLVGLMRGRNFLVRVRFDVAFKTFGRTVDKTADIAFVLLLQIVNFFVFFKEFFHLESTWTFVARVAELVTHGCVCKKKIKIFMTLEL